VFERGVLSAEPRVLELNRKKGARNDSEELNQNYRRRSGKYVRGEDP
jgi:hypothetical protein